MIKQYQVTLMNKDKRLKPISCLIKKDQEDNSDLSTTAKKILLCEGVKKICQKRYVSYEELRKQGYDIAKIRLYDAAVIEAEKQAKYDAIKEAKYESGEWKRPKSKG